MSTAVLFLTHKISVFDQDRYVVLRSEVTANTEDPGTLDRPIYAHTADRSYLVAFGSEGETTWTNSEYEAKHFESLEEAEQAKDQVEAQDNSHPSD